MELNRTQLTKLSKNRQCSNTTFSNSQKILSSNPRTHRPERLWRFWFSGAATTVRNVYIRVSGRPRPKLSDRRGTMTRLLKRTFGQIFPAERTGCGRQGLHFGMGGGIAERFDHVVAAPEDAVPANNDRPDRYLSLFQRFLRLIYCHTHVLCIGIEAVVVGLLLHASRVFLMVTGPAVSRMYP